jgi:hypothetical protein
MRTANLSWLTIRGVAMIKYTYQKMYVDEPDQWQDVDEHSIRRSFEGYYKDVDGALAILRNGDELRTPWAIYRTRREVVASKGNHE